MSIILRKYSVLRNCVRYQVYSFQQNEVRRFLSCSRLLQNQPKREVAPSNAEKQEGQLQTSFAKKGDKLSSQVTDYAWWIEFSLVLSVSNSILHSTDKVIHRTAERAHG